jgi:hypothetical protein
MVSQITVVLQGPVDWNLVEASGLPTTFYNIRMLRSLLPQCEIILSTWENEKTELLPVDTVIYNKDPGPQPSRIPDGIINNVNRQIVSTVAGLKAATHPYTLKMRTDIVLLGTNFLRAFERAKFPVSSAALFERKIISNNLTSRNPRAIVDVPLPFHPSDHIHFGLTTDLLTFWDVPLQTDEDADYFLTQERPNHFRDHETSRLIPEQHICLGAFKKKFSVELTHYSDSSQIDQGEKLLLENFIFIKDRDFSIHFSKYHTPYHAQFEWLRYPKTSKKITLHQRIKITSRKFRKLVRGCGLTPKLGQF